MKKSDVNGDNTSEVYKWLKNEKAGLLGLTRIKVCCQNQALYCDAEAPFSKWNFEKFLVDKNGKVVNRWASTTSPSAIDAEIQNIL
jgi:glutathione peroxidase-family protein